VEDDERREARDKVLADWPSLNAREKGEALRQLFQTVKLYWNKKFNQSEAKPSRPRKTDRPGRFKYTLDAQRIEWGFGENILSGSR
jgi:hypothetical protein